MLLRLTTACSDSSNSQKVFSPEFLFDTALAILFESNQQNIPHIIYLNGRPDIIQSVTCTKLIY
jgi:hypothetical protein